MAKLFTGILGSGRGKVANVVMGRWKGIDYIRAYAVPANPRTQPQVANRNKFTEATKNASIFTEYLRLLPNFMPKKSNFNLVVSAVFRGKDLLQAVAGIGEGEPAFTSIDLNSRDSKVTLSGNLLAGDRVIVAVGTTTNLSATSEEKPKVYEATVAGNARTFTIDAPIPSNPFAIGTLIRANKALTGVSTSTLEVG